MQKMPRSSSESAVRIEGLRFGYKPNQLVLDVPSLEVRRGARVFLHGPSGSGKTTLLGILAGILDPGAGKVEVLGRDFAKLGGRERDHFRGAHIGYIFQMFNLIPYLDVEQNITLPCRISKERNARLGGKAPEVAARELAEHLGIALHLKKSVTELSVGQQQRVAAARALIGGPELIIADEPTSALDTDHREAFLRLLFAEAERFGAGVLFVSHDQSLKPLFPTLISLRDVNRAAQPKE